MTFLECAVHCVGNRELVQQFNRLTGHHMGEARSPIEVTIDKNCGYDPNREAFPAFLDFVDQYIWLPLFEPSSLQTQ